jgi:excisionase family DNA binding protein
MDKVNTFLRKADLARLLQVSRRTIDRWISNGRFPRGRRIGGTKRWLRADLERILGEGLGDLAGASK